MSPFQTSLDHNLLFKSFYKAFIGEFGLEYTPMSMAKSLNYLYFQLDNEFSIDCTLYNYFSKTKKSDECKVYYTNLVPRRLITFDINKIKPTLKHLSSILLYFYILQDKYLIATGYYNPNIYPKPTS